MSDPGVQTPEEQSADRPAEAQPTLLTTPTHVHRHSAPLRGIDVIPSSEFGAGRFGRMFRNVPVFLHEEAVVVELGRRMIADPAPVPIPEEDEDPRVNPHIPAGYTYLGQFIDHDITFDPASSLERQNDPDAINNFRTPRFDLDSLYGSGPADQPYLYRHGSEPIPHPQLPEVDLRHTIFRLGDPVDSDPAFAGPDLPRDMPRQLPDGTEVFHGRALIGDPRNDENLIVSQLHSVFLKFHNKVVELVAAETPLRDENLFKEAQRLVRWHYQWVAIHDFLARIVGDAVVDDMLRPIQYVTAAGPVELIRPRLQFYRHPGRSPYMPIEWSVAAYRFGHSMIRDSYFFNDFVKEAAGGRTLLFKADATPEDELSHLNGFRRLPEKWGFQWKFFFDVEPGFAPQDSFRIDTNLANPLGNLPPQVASNPSSLAERNLIRGLRMGVPSGQTVARAMGVEPLNPQELGIEDLDAHLAQDTPLWYYILREAEVREDGMRLGAVGGRIVAEVMIGLLAADPLSFISVAPAFRPGAPFVDEDGDFRMADLIRFATS